MRLRPFILKSLKENNRFFYAFSNITLSFWFGSNFIIFLKLLIIKTKICYKNNHLLWKHTLYLYFSIWVSPPPIHFWWMFLPASTMCQCLGVYKQTLYQCQKHFCQTISCNNLSESWIVSAGMQPRIWHNIYYIKWYCTGERSQKRSKNTTFWSNVCKSWRDQWFVGLFAKRKLIFSPFSYYYTLIQRYYPENT